MFGDYHGDMSYQDQYLSLPLKRGLINFGRSFFVVIDLDNKTDKWQEDTRQT